MPEQTDIYISSFPDAESITNADKVTGLQGNVNKNFTFSSILAWFVNAVKSAFVPVSRTINGVTLDTNITLTAQDVGARPNTWTPSAADVGAQPTITASGILKGDGAGGVSAATAGTDYATPAQLADKAAKADLTNIQATGTTNTTGAAIPAGAFFYLNGILYRAKTQIDQNATFTVNTNCEQVMAGGFNNLRLKHMDITATPSAVGNVQINSNTGNAVTYNNFVNAVVIDNTGTSIFIRIFTYANLIYANVIDLNGNYITTQVKIRVYYV